MAVAPPKSEGKLGVLEVYSWAQVVERLRSGAFDPPAGRGAFASYGGWERFVAACGLGSSYIRDVQPEHSLRRLVAYVMGGLCASPGFAGNPGADPGWIRELALFHSTVYQVLEPTTDTRGFVDPDFDGSGAKRRNPRRLFFRARGTASPVGVTGNLALEEWGLEGPAWYVDLGGSRTVRDLTNFLADAVAGRDAAARLAAEKETALTKAEKKAAADRALEEQRRRAGPEGEAALARLGSALEELDEL